MKSVGVADLKNRLSEYLRLVRRGRSIIVTDREQPVARLVPCGTDAARPRTSPAVRPFGEFRRWKAPAPPPSLDVDAVALLIEDRSRR